MLSLNALSLGQLAGLTLGQFSAFALDYTGPVYSVRLLAVAGYTTDARTAAIGIGSTVAASAYRTTNAAQSAKDQA